MYHLRDEIFQKILCFNWGIDSLLCTIRYIKLQYSILRNFLEPDCKHIAVLIIMIMVFKVSGPWLKTVEHNTKSKRVSERSMLRRRYVCEAPVIERS